MFMQDKRKGEAMHVGENGEGMGMLSFTNRPSCELDMNIYIVVVGTNIKHWKRTKDILPLRNEKDLIQ